MPAIPQITIARRVTLTAIDPWVVAVTRRTTREILIAFSVPGFVLMNPAALFADIGDLAGEIIDAGPLGIIAEGFHELGEQQVTTTLSSLLSLIA